MAFANNAAQTIISFDWSHSSGKLLCNNNTPLLRYVNINKNICIPQTPTVRPRAHYIVIIWHCVIWSIMYDWKERFSVLGEKQMLILFFSVQSAAAGFTLAVQQCKMLDPPFSGSSVARHSLRDWRPAVRTGMKWQRLAGVSLWCSLATVQVMPCGWENTA